MKTSKKAIEAVNGTGKVTAFLDLSNSYYDRTPGFYLIGVGDSFFVWFLVAGDADRTLCDALDEIALFCHEKGFNGLVTENLIDWLGDAAEVEKAYEQGCDDATLCDCGLWLTSSWCVANV